MRWKIFVASAILGSIVFQVLGADAAQPEALVVPFSTQFDGSRYAATDCGPASVAMAINYATGSHLTPIQAQQELMHLPGGRRHTVAPCRALRRRAAAADRAESVYGAKPGPHRSRPGAQHPSNGALNRYLSVTDRASPETHSSRSPRREETAREWFWAPDQPALYSAHQTSPLKLVGTALLNTVRTVATLATIAAGVVVVFGALPAQLRHSVQTPVELPDTTGQVSLVHVPIGNGYDFGMALPYALGFLALFIGMGPLQREPSLASRR